MPREKPSADAIACECESFYCYSIAHRNRDDTRDIRAFEAIHESGIGLSEYLRDCAYRDEREGVMRTYLVRDGSSNEFVGYFSIKAGAISPNERAVGDKTTFDTIPSAEIACLALDRSYRAIHLYQRSKERAMVGKIFVGIADGDWYDFCRERQATEVNFWKPICMGGIVMVVSRGGKRPSNGLEALC